MEKLWKYKKIGEVCIVERGASPRPIDKYITDNESGINWIKIGDTSDSMYITETAQKIIVEGMKKSRYVKPGDFLLSNSMSFGRPYILKIDGCIHDGWLVLRDENALFDKRFLYYYLSSKTTYKKLKSMAVGGVVNNLNSEMVRNVIVPVPDKEEQSEIADLFDKIKKILDDRKQELEQLDTLVKSRFVELFGDPIKNPKGWEVVKLSECLERIDNGKSFTCDSNAREGVFPAILKLSAATYGDYRPYENKALLDEKQFVESVEVHRGDLLFTRKNTPDLVGMAAYVFETPEKLMMPDLIFRLVTNERMTPTFLWQLINNREFRPAIQGISGGSAKSMSNISKERLKNIEVICPPISEQKKLEGVLEQVDKLKSKIQKSLEETQLLFDSLMQKYFG